MAQQSAGARLSAGPAAVRDLPGPLSSQKASTKRPISRWGFAGVAVASFGGPLALAGLAAPGIIADASDSAGLTALLSVVVFAVPLALWLRYSQHINSSGGLYGFVEAAVGRWVALVQAGIWIFSYLLYVSYTTVQIVYDLMPSVVPGERQYQTLLALLIPVTIAAVIIAGRAVALLVLGLIAAGQIALAFILDGVTIANISTPVSTFGTGAAGGSLTKAAAQMSLLYICGSLPLFLGGELARPARTIRRGLIGSLLLTGLVVVLAVAPLAAAPGLLNTDVPGVTVAQEFSGQTLAYAIGIGIAVSTAGVILCEYLALTRLMHAIGPWSMRTGSVAIGALVVLAAPFTLIDPEGFYSTLLKPSLVALWLSQLIVFAAYPRFAAKHGQRLLPAWTLSVGASALAIYALWMTVHHASS